MARCAAGASPQGHGVTRAGVYPTVSASCAPRGFRPHAALWGIGQSRSCQAAEALPHHPARGGASPSATSIDTRVDATADRHGYRAVPVLSARAAPGHRDNLSLTRPRRMASDHRAPLELACPCSVLSPEPRARGSVGEETCVWSPRDMRKASRAMADRRGLQRYRRLLGGRRPPRCLAWAGIVHGRQPA